MGIITSNPKNRPLLSIPGPPLAGLHPSSTSLLPQLRGGFPVPVGTGKGELLMSELRETLKPYLHKRVTVRGTFAKFDTTWKTGYRYTGRGTILSPEIDGEVVCDHVSVVDVGHWKDYQKAIGSQVTFDAVVQKYTDKCGNPNYCFGNASEPTLLHQPPALVTFDLPQESEPQGDVPSASVEEIEPPTHSAPVSTAANPMERIRQVRVFAKACGGYDKAEEVVASMPLMPLPELLDYIRALKD
jgi:hypothetical protein